MIDPTKLQSLSKGYDATNDRENMFIQILKKNQKFSEDDVVFTIKYFQHYLQDVIKELFLTLDKIFMTKLCQIFGYKYIEKSENFSLFSQPSKHAIIIQGNLTLLNPNGHIVKSFKNGQIITPNYSNSGIFSCENEVHLVDFSVEEFTKIYKEYKSERDDTAQRALGRNIQKYRQLDLASQDQNLKYFKKEVFSKGQLISLPKTSRQVLSFVIRGKVALFVGKSQDFQYYSRDFILLSVIGQEQCLNEHPLCFGLEYQYGVLCIENCEILILEKSNMQLICDNQSIEILRAHSYSKDRLYQQIISRLKLLTNEQLYEQQKQFAFKQNFDFFFIEQNFQKEKDQLKENQKARGLGVLDNLKKASGIGGMRALPSRKEETSDAHKQIFATPQLRKRGVDNAEKELQLIKLREMGMCRRAIVEGKDLPNNSILKLGGADSDKASNLNSRFLQEETDEVQQFLIKKGISDKKNISNNNEANNSSNINSNSSVQEKMRTMDKFMGGMGSNSSSNNNDSNDIKDNPKRDIEMDIILKQRNTWAQSRAAHNPFAKNLLKNPNMI